jgi:RNA polymerase sigma factor (sigma-70 family)
MAEELVTRLRQARAGDRQALDGLLERVRPHLEARARRVADPGRAADSVSDLVQEAGVLAWKNLPAFQGGQTDEETERMLFAWLGQIVHRLGIDARRSAKAQRRRPQTPLLSLDQPADSYAGGGLHPPAGDPTPSANVRFDETTQRVREALARLKSDESRTLVRIVFVEGRSLRQAAEEMGLTYDQVRLRYRQALVELEKALGGLV